MYNDPLLPMFVVSFLLNVGLALYGWRHRQLPGAKVFSLAMLFFAVLPITQVVNDISPDLAIKVIAFKSRVEIAGIGATLWLVMMIQLSGYSHWVNRRNLITLSIMPFVILILNWTENPLFRSGYYLDTVGSSTILRWSIGPLFWFGLVYLNIVLLTPLYLLWRSYRRISSLSLQQTFALSISVALPITLNLLIQVHVLSIPAINFPFAAGPLMGLIAAWVIFRYHLFDVVPIARGLLIESMSDGVMVLDTQNRIVDINPAMQQLIGPIKIGQNAESAFAAWPDLVARFRDVTEARTEITVDENPPLYFDLRISALYENGTQLTGRLIVIRDITRLKQTELALRTSETNFRHMLEAAPDAMVIVDQVGNIKFVNAQSEKIFGYEQAEMLGQPVEILLPERFHEIHISHRANYYQDPRTRPMGTTKWELVARRKNSSEFPVEINLSPLETETGIFAIAAVRDVSETKRVESELQAALTRAEMLYAVTKIGISSTSLPGMLQETVERLAQGLPANRASLIIFDQQMQQVKNFVRGGPGADYAVLSVAYDELMDGLSGWAIRTRQSALSPKGAPDPRESPTVWQRRAETNCGSILVTPLHYQDQILGTLTVINLPTEPDFTDRDLVLLEAIASQVATAIIKATLYDNLQQANQALSDRTVQLEREIAERKQVEIKLQIQAAALQAAANAIAITNNDGMIEWVNPAFTRLTGYTAEESIGHNMQLIRSKRHDEAFYQNLWDTIQSGSVWEDEIINLNKDGSEYTELQTITPVRNEQGEVNHFIAIKQDITERKQAEDALREAELKYRTLVEQMPAVVYIDMPDEAAASSYVSPQVEALLGYPLAEWKRNPYFWFRCIHPDDYERAVAIIRNTLTKGRATEEYRMVSHDGRVVWIRDHSLLVRDANGQSQFVQGFWEDVTDRKQAEERRMILYETLRRQNDYFETLHQISLDLLNRRDVDDLLTAIINSATRLLDAPYGDLDIVEGDVMITRAYTANQSFEKDLRTPRGESGAASWQAYDTRQVVIIDDYAKWPQQNPVFESISVHATIIAPLISGEHCLGVFSLARAEPEHPFTPDEIRLATLFAQQAAIALDNTQLYTNAQREIEERKHSEETLRRQNDYLSALHEITLGLINRHDPDTLLEAILFHIADMMKTRHAYVEIIDPTKNVLVEKVALGNYVPQLGYRTARGEGLTGQVWDTGEMLIIRDYPTWPDRLPEFDWLRTVAGIPLKIQGKVIGVIGISFDETGRTFTPEEIDLLQRFANLASVALDNARLISEATRQSQELSLLHKVRSAIASEIDLANIVKRTVEAIVETFGYTLVSLYLREGDMLILQHQVGYENVISTIPITSGVSGQVMRTGEPVFLEDAHSDTAFLEAIEGIVSEVAVPLLDQGRTVGVLNIESRYGVKLTEADLRLMLALSDQISIAIGRARLYNSLQRNNERLSILHEISLDLLNQRKLDDLLQTITDQSVKLQDAVVSYIALKEGDELVDRAITPRGLPYQMTGAGGGNDISPVWQVFESREPFITDDYSSLPNIRPETAALGVKAAMLLPILYGETCRGVLGTGRTQPNYPFNEEDINFGGLFAKLTAVALDNAQLHHNLREESIRDPLTGLFNRRYMQEALTQEVLKAKRNSRPLAVVMLDLDHFKNLNDTFGHDAGDEALRGLGLLLKTTIRGSDVVCRYGGEEFSLILPETSLADTLQRMEQLRQDIKALTIRHGGKSIDHLSGSFGIAVYPNHGSTGETLLKSADEALYRAKHGGRDQVVAA